MARQTPKSVPNSSTPTQLHTQQPRKKSQTKQNLHSAEKERSPIAEMRVGSQDQLEKEECGKKQNVENADKKIAADCTKLDDEATCCPICYDSLSSDAESNSNRVCLHGCQHLICRDCLKSHCEHWIVSKQKLPGIPCPRYASGCTHHLSREEVKRALQDPVLWKRYLKAVHWYHHPTWISCWCPNCNELVQQPPPPPSPNSSGSTNNRLTCAKCHFVFCKIHGKAHDIRVTSCEQYQASLNEQRSQATLRKYCKPCSRCGSHISKESGCDHVICTACGEDMCYKCGTHEHLTGTSIRHCGKCRQGYLDHRYNCRHRAKALLVLPLLLPFYLGYILIMTIVAVISLGFCCCCGCSAHLERDSPAERTPWRAVQVGTYAVILPLLFVATEFGFHFDLIDEITMTPAQNALHNQTLPDIPVLTMDEEEDERMEEMEQGTQKRNIK